MQVEWTPPDSNPSPDLQVNLGLNLHTRLVVPLPTRIISNETETVKKLEAQVEEQRAQLEEDRKKFETEMASFLQKVEILARQPSEQDRRIEELRKELRKKQVQD